MSDLSVTQQRALAALTRLPVVARLGDAFAAEGFSLYVVGGPVRDALLGTPSEDLDFTTNARPDDIERLLRTFNRATWDMGREFGTIGTMLRDGDRSWQVEVTTYRADAYEPGTRKPVVAFGDTIHDDLVRRDFTVNAMAVSVVDGEFVDPYHGLEDLADHILRTPTSPEVSFSDDPLRMLRAARFAARLQLMPDPDLVRVMAELAPRLEIVSAERIRDELTKLLLLDAPRVGLDLLVGTGLADQFLPELPALRLESDEHHRHKDVYEHSLIVLDQAIALEQERHHAPDIVNRLAALLHDIGKPRTRRFEAGGKVSFHHHDVVGAKMVRKRLTALRYSKDVVDSVALLVELHLRFHGYGEGTWTDSAVRRYVRDAGPELERLHILTRSDCTTRNQAKADRLRRAYEELEWRIDELAAAEELDAMRPDLNGNEIMRVLGIGPSPMIGKAYTFLLERRLDRGPVPPEVAEAELREWWAAQQH
ncbi:MAG TPA: CCA tRNA nucleotidyltransferase [Propionibacteriaceae bacterium]|nr:CCA tRNA nucleotidyltransferase [Propionibacteriaceae bacterium]